MTYSSLPVECSRYCSGWQSFLLGYGEMCGQLQPLKSPLHCLRGWMDIPLRNHDAAVTGNSHDGESVHSGFPKPCKHCMAKRVEHEIAREDRPTLSFHLWTNSVTMHAVDRGSHIGFAFPVGKDEPAGYGLFPSPQPDWDYTVLPALALADGHDGRRAVHIVELEPEQFGAPHSGRVKHLQHRSVADAERVGDVGLMQDQLGLRRGQHARQRLGKGPRILAGSVGTVLVHQP
jgi:hypothetical protein